MTLCPFDSIVKGHYYVTFIHMLSRSVLGKLSSTLKVKLKVKYFIFWLILMIFLFAVLTKPFIRSITNFDISLYARVYFSLNGNISQLVIKLFNVVNT